MKNVIMLVLSMVCGYVGGRFEGTTQRQEPALVSIIRSNRFELVGSTGQTVAWLGLDANRNPLLTFEDNHNRPVARFGLRTNGLEVSPFFDLAGKDGKSRMRLQLDYGERPLIGMGDEKWEGKVLLGFIEGDSPTPDYGDWGLLFQHPDLASIGVIRDPKSGRVRGSLAVRMEEGQGFYFPANHHCASYRSRK